MAEVLKTNNMGFKLRSGNKPSMARISGVEKISDYNKQQKQIYDEKLQEYNRKSKRYQNQKEIDRLYNQIEKIEDDRSTAIDNIRRGVDNDEDVYSYSARINKNYEELDALTNKIYAEKTGLTRDYAKLMRENRKLYREGDRRHYDDYVRPRKKGEKTPDFDELFHPGEKPREPMYQAELNVKRLKNIDMGGTPTETIEYKGPEYFQHKIDDKNKQVYVRKDLANNIYGENAKDLKTTEDGAYVIVDYKERSKLQKLGDRIGSSVENLFNRGSRPRPKYRKNLVTGGTNVIM